MKNLRQWEITDELARALYLTADARLCRTNHLDDQVWQLRLGQGESPALALQTKYGGRAGLVSIVPIWNHDNHVIYQAQSYHQAPVITHFAPNLIIAQGQILRDVTLKATYWTMESQATGGFFTVTNNTDAPVNLRFELYAHVIIQGHEQRLLPLERAGGGQGVLLTDQLANLKPIVTVDRGQVDLNTGISPRLSVEIQLKPGKFQTIRWVHAGLATARDSFKLAINWLEQDWKAHLNAIDASARAIPTIQTGDITRDAGLAIAYQRLLQAVLRPAGHLPDMTFVSIRTPETGFSRHSPQNRPRGWDGQDMYSAYLLTSALASIYPEAAQGIIRNFIATQKPNGYIDQRPGTDNQRLNMLGSPLLARMAMNVYQQTGDTTFIKETLPALVLFFSHWLSEANDKDKDGIPEWQQDQQTGYVAWPPFAPARNWSQGLAIQYAETPDLLAYLIQEANALITLAEAIKDSDTQKTIEAARKRLITALGELWDGKQFSYRDRDTHQALAGQQILSNGAGDVEHFIRTQLDTPNRLIIRVVGGVSHIPKIQVTINGLDDTGEPVQEIINSDAFMWQNRQGTATTNRIFASVDRIKADGLSRVYRINASTPDLRSSDLINLLPVIIPQIDAKQRQTLVKHLVSSEFLRQNGWTMTAATSDHFDPSNAEGAGGVWLFWNTLIGMALADTDAVNKTGDVLKNLLDTITRSLQTSGAFGQFYHADEAFALGEPDHLLGIAPLYWFQQAVGINITSANTVWVGGTFAWGRSITIRQHGIYVRRTSKGIKVRFASGHEVTLPPDAKWQKLTDPKPIDDAVVAPITPPKTRPKPNAPTQPETKAPKRVIIDIEIDE